MRQSAIMRFKGNQEQSSHHDLSLLNRIKGISAANYVIGIAEVAGGLMTNSSTLTMAGMHDIGDGALYKTKHSAAIEQEPGKKRSLRLRAAGALIGLTALFGTYEIATHYANEDKEPVSAAIPIALAATSLNLGAATLMHGKKHDHDGKDTWRHVAHVDAPSSLITLVAVPLSLKFPDVDVAGAAAHISLAAFTGLRTVQEILSTNDYEEANPR
jgi:Co/Zn/Cd efflux system component